MSARLARHANEPRAISCLHPDGPAQLSNGWLTPAASAWPRAT
jgi:hypothetical protein